MAACGSTLISSANELALIGSLLESRSGGTWGNRG
jgi:hypothetical protein